MMHHGMHDGTTVERGCFPMRVIALKSAVELVCHHMHVHSRAVGTLCMEGVTLVRQLPSD